MKFVLILLFAIIATSAAFKVKIHSDAQKLAERIAKRIESAIASKNADLVRAQFHHDFHFHDCHHKRLTLADSLKFLSKLPEEFTYTTEVIHAKKIGHKSIKFAVKWAFDSHISAYQFVATRHHGQYRLEKGKRTDCHIHHLI